MAGRVVITGLGSVCALGIGAPALWEGLLAGRSALGRIRRFDPSGFHSRLGGEAPEFAIKDFVPKSYRKATKVMARDIELAVVAARAAVEDAGITTRGSGEDLAPDALTYRPERMGCHIGAGLIAAELDEMAAAMATARTPAGEFSLRAWGGEGGQGMEALTPLWLLKYLPNMLACHVTIIHGAEGPSNTITCSEASGLLSIGESMRVIERGAADLCFSGSAESKINPMGLLRIEYAGRLAPTGDAAEGAPLVRPYDPAATGGVIGEGGAIVILENADTAAKRGAKVYAEVVGFGGGHSDAAYAAGEDDEGYRYAIENALEDAGLTPADIDVLVPMASGVPALDRAELGALKRVFGPRLGEVPMVTLHPAIGNCVAGASGLQVVAGALCLKHQHLPARLHAGTPAQGVQAGPAPARPASKPLRHALLCSGSLGGQNAAVVLKAV
jgi:3-oxoacyl-[acyl-carrier-protein] synthase II